MTVYVDDMRRPAYLADRRGRWSHLVADSSEELHEFAALLGLLPGWIQRPGTHREHFDVTDTMRRRAIALGAERITYPRGMADFLAGKRVELEAASLLRGSTVPAVSIDLDDESPHTPLSTAPGAGKSMPAVPGECQWYLLCERPATDVQEHPTLGPVPICAGCKQNYPQFCTAAPLIARARQTAKAQNL